MKQKLIVTGAAGRMGRRIIALAAESGKFALVGAVEDANHPDIGKDAGQPASAGELGIKLSADYPKGADVVIDFSQPKAADKTLEYCVENGCALVLGTTGLSDKQKGKIQAASQKIPIVYGTNMSVGMNVVFSAVGNLAKQLGSEYDIEIIEQHHRFKKDAPSGTALTLAEKICEATGGDFQGRVRFGREGKDAIRQKGEIGIHAVRAGDITGIHTVVFSTLGETVSINHTAHSRDGFAAGALRAAEWLAGKRKGLYSMADVLGLGTEKD